MITALAKYLRDFSFLMFPVSCASCKRSLDDGEEVLCEGCKERLPRTHYWKQNQNTVERLFWAKIPIEGACAHMFFSKGGVVQELMHQLKYRGITKVGYFLGYQFGQELAQTSFGEVDCIIPVPLHSQKEKKRGYNQCKFIAEGLSESMHVDVEFDVVERLRANDSQTQKGKYERWINVKELFAVVNPERIQGKHILLIDDVVTTGATLEACAAALLMVPNTKVSIAAIATPSPI